MKAAKERPAQDRKRIVKLNWLIRNMPNGAAIAIARLGASMK